MKRARSRARVEGLQETYRISWGARRVIQSMAASARPGRGGSTTTRSTAGGMPGGRAWLTSAEMMSTLVMLLRVRFSRAAATEGSQLSTAMTRSATAARCRAMGPVPA